MQIITTSQKSYSPPNAAGNPRNIETVTIFSADGTELLKLVENNDGSVSVTSNGEAIASGGSPTYETPTGAVNGSNTTFTFSAPPILVFLNEGMSNEVGTIDGNDFIFNSAPNAPDVVRGLV